MSQETDPNPKMPRLFLIVLGALNADGSDQRLLFESDYEAWDPLWVKHAE